MGVWVHGEPGAYVVVTLGSPARKDFIDGASGMLLDCWGHMPELACVDVTVWGWLWRPLQNWWELCSECSREVVRRHPLLSSV